MFKRLIIDEPLTVCTLIAFFTTASIFLSFLWRAIRMKPSQVQHFENLPFETENPTSRHDA